MSTQCSRKAFYPTEMIVIMIKNTHLLLEHRTNLPVELRGRNTLTIHTKYQAFDRERTYSKDQNPLA